MTKINVYQDGNFCYGYVLQAGESIPRDGFGITYVVSEVVA